MQKRLARRLWVLPAQHGSSLYAADTGACNLLQQACQRTKQSTSCKGMLCMASAMPVLCFVSHCRMAVVAAGPSML
jgi:hypothetical protein